MPVPICSRPHHKLTGVLAKQVCPSGQPAPLGQSRAHELTASTQEVPQKFPLACTTTTGVVVNATVATDARDEMFSFIMVLYYLMGPSLGYWQLADKNGLPLAASANFSVMDWNEILNARFLASRWD